MNRLTTLTLTALSLSLAACGRSPAEQLPEVTFQTERGVSGAALVTDRVTMRFAGFEPGARVTVRARMEDGASSFADFQVGPDGSFDTAGAPISGSYAGSDADGLFWSMGGRGPQLLTSGSLDVEITVEAAGSELLRAKLERYQSIDLMPIPRHGRCGAVGCPQPVQLPELPVDARAVASPLAASATDDVPEEPCGAAPRPVGPTPLPELEVAVEQEVAR